MAASRPASQGSRAFIFYTHLHDQSGFASALGFKYAKLNYLALLAEIFKALINLRKLEILVPHVSRYIMDPVELRFFQILGAHDCLTYYDDGMSALSRRTHLFRVSSIPQGALIHSWAYEYFLKRPDAIGVFPLVSIRSLIDLAARSAWLTGCKVGRTTSDFNTYNQDSSSEELSISRNLFSRYSTGVILSSKSLDSSFALLESKRRLAASHTYYIPHYQPNKNDPALYAELDKIYPAQVELFLFSLSRYTSVDLFFGVSSSVILLIELVLNSPDQHRLNLVSCIDPKLSNASDLDECEDFVMVLKWYQNNSQLQANGISMSPIYV